ncbi:restriction endonuclease [Burkholderia gladioli]|uniref:restriction endonuclease n=1 Tax=Burkholderia gladioli TaxID=28095 RepID=UPI0038B2940E
MFHLHTLGWHSFQQLCLSVLREVLGQTVQSFLDINDGGRDGAFSGTWRQQNGEALSGRFVIQCKFTGRAGYALTPSDIQGEISKVSRLASKSECDVWTAQSTLDTPDPHAAACSKASGLRPPR